MLERFARKYALECTWKKGGSDPRRPEGRYRPFYVFRRAPVLRFGVCYLFALKCLRSGACGEPYGEPLGKPPNARFSLNFEFGSRE